MNRLTKEQASKLVKNRNRQVAKANKAFDKMTPSQKRVYIARDVLAQLKSKKLIATTGFWLETNSPVDLDDKRYADKEVKDVLKGQKECTGCALGGMFMCAVNAADKLKMSKLDDDSYTSYGFSLDFDDVHSYLRRFFSQEQLEEIETAFERGIGEFHGSDYALNFAHDEDDPSERMRLIMENIVVHKGKFVPQYEPDRAYSTPGFEG